jgi:hypothetical protein
LYQGNCQTTSDYATLTVENLTGLFNNQGFSKNSIEIYPVPFSDATKVKFIGNANGTFYITITNLFGQIVADFLWSSVSEGSRHIELNTSNWPSGIYIFTSKQDNSDGAFECIKKIVKK